MHPSKLAPLVLNFLRINDSQGTAEWLLSVPGDEPSEKLNPLIWQDFHSKKFMLDMVDVHYTFDTFREAWAYANEHWGVDAIGFGCYREPMRREYDENGEEFPMDNGEYYKPEDPNIMLPVSKAELESLRYAVEAGILETESYRSSIATDQGHDVRLYVLAGLAKRIAALPESAS